VPYAEVSGFSTNLTNLRNGSGALSGVAALRETHHADLVTMLVHPPAPDACGIAFLMTSVTSAFAVLGVQRGPTRLRQPQLLVRARARSQHGRAARLVRRQRGRRRSRMRTGHVNAASTQRWRTIMAYPDQCTAQGFNCTRLLFWANPQTKVSRLLRPRHQLRRPAVLVFRRRPDGHRRRNQRLLSVGEHVGDRIATPDDSRTLNDSALTVANFPSGQPNRDEIADPAVSRVCLGSPRSGPLPSRTANASTTRRACRATAPPGQGDRGPALNRGTFVHGNEDGDLFRTIRAGVPGSEMPPFARLTDEQVWQLVSYIRSLERPDSPPATAASVSADATAGEGVFFGQAQCSACHEVNGRGGIVGPDLSTAGRLSAQALRQKILRPAEPIATGRGAPPPPQVVVARTKDGRELRGVRRNEDTFTAQIVDASGTLHLLDKATLATYRVERASMMPSDYGTRLSAAEVDQVVAYLGTLKARSVSSAAAAMPAGGVTADRLVRSDAEPHNWLMYWGNYQSTHYSALDQITAGNVRRLGAAWTFPMPATRCSKRHRSSSTV
jgi:putative heme-binding domain-containing protein